MTAIPDRPSRQSPPTRPTHTAPAGPPGATRTLAAELGRAVPGETVTLRGHVHRRRALASVTFLVVRDRTGLAQVVLRGDDAAPHLPPEETPVEVTGLATPNAQAPGGVEVTRATITPLSDEAVTPPVELWRPRLAASLPTLLDNAAVAWRHPARRARWELAAASLAGFRSVLDAAGFTEIRTPHGGFAIGLERWVARLVGSANIREVTLFPRDLHRLAP